MSDYILVISGVVLIIAGMAGCFLPVLPGPPLSFIAIVLLHLSKFGQFGDMTLILLGSLAVITTIIDFAIPAWGTKKFGGSQYGVRGTAIGIIAGLFLPPIGIIIGPLLGAFIGEMIFKNDVHYALRAAVGSFIGFLTGVGLKFAVSAIITFMFFRELIRYF